MRQQVYPLQYISEDHRLRYVAHLLYELKDWHKSFPPGLAKPRNLLFRRQAALLELGYYHASILLTRPFVKHPYFPPRSKEGRCRRLSQALLRSRQARPAVHR